MRARTVTIVEYQWWNADYANPTGKFINLTVGSDRRSVKYELADLSFFAVYLARGRDFDDGNSNQPDYEPDNPRVVPDTPCLANWNMELPSIFETIKFNFQLVRQMGTWRPTSRPMTTQDKLWPTRTSNCVWVRYHRWPPTRMTTNQLQTGNQSWTTKHAVLNLC